MKIINVSWISDWIDTLCAPILKKTSNKQVGKGAFSRVSYKHAFAHGITMSMLHDGESDGGGQVMRVRNEFLTGENI